MVYKMVLNCTHTNRIKDFLQSPKCQDENIRSVHLDDKNALAENIKYYSPMAVILSSNLFTIAEMRNIVEQYSSHTQFILCIGPAKGKNIKRDIKVLQEEYKCSIIENIVIDLILFNAILECVVTENEYLEVGDDFKEEPETPNQTVESAQHEDNHSSPTSTNITQEISPVRVDKPTIKEVPKIEALDADDDFEF